MGELMQLGEHRGSKRDAGGGGGGFLSVSVVGVKMCSD